MTSIDISRWFRQELFLGALLPTALGVSGVVAGIIGATEPPDSVAVRIVVGILGLLFLAIGGGLYYWLFFATPRSWLDADGDGLGLRRREGTHWRVSWHEVTSASVVRTHLSSKRLASGPSLYWTWRYPRHYLRLVVTAEAARRPEIKRALFGPHASTRHLNIDLGVPAHTAKQVLTGLGQHLHPQGIVRLESGSPGAGTEV